MLRRRADVRYRIIDEEGVVVRQNAGEVLVLNDLGTRILGLADGAAPVADWIDALVLEFEVDRPQLERDVLAFAAELVEQGLLEPAPAIAATAPAAPRVPASPETPETPETPGSLEAPETPESSAPHAPADRRAAGGTGSAGGAGGRA